MNSNSNRFINEFKFKQIYKYIEGSNTQSEKGKLLQKKRYIAEEGRHWTERLLWIFLVILGYKS